MLVPFQSPPLEVDLFHFFYELHAHIYIVVSVEHACQAENLLFANDEFIIANARAKIYVNYAYSRERFLPIKTVGG